jgi:endonuclease YncB( thermonuclease family)
MQSPAPRPGWSSARRRRCAGARVRRRILALCPLLAAAAGIGAEPFLEGRVVAVFDGDTLEVLVGGAPRRIRIAGIDTPERGQPWAGRARRALSDRVFGKQVKVNEVAEDRYGRTVGEVYADDVCVGCELVRAGHAWVYRGFTDDRILFDLEAEARAAARGLWSLPESQRTPPWEWRESRRRSAEKRGAARGPRRDQMGAAPTADRACGAKRTCGQMTHCEEARFYLRECGLTSLDGDADGVPCEALCATD